MHSSNKILRTSLYTKVKFSVELKLLSY